MSATGSTFATGSASPAWFGSGSGSGSGSSCGSGSGCESAWDLRRRASLLMSAPSSSDIPTASQSSACIRAQVSQLNLLSSSTCTCCSRPRPDSRSNRAFSSSDSSLRIVRLPFASGMPAAEPEWSPRGVRLSTGRTGCGNSSERAAAGASWARASAQSCEFDKPAHDGEFADSAEAGGCWS